MGHIAASLHILNIKYCKRVVSISELPVLLVLFDKKMYNNIMNRVHII